MPPLCIRTVLLNFLWAFGIRRFDVRTGPVHQGAVEGMPGPVRGRCHIGITHPTGRFGSGSRAFGRQRGRPRSRGAPDSTR
jgi:hypothetical protein